MRLFLLILLFPFSLAAQHRTISKTIFYDKPNGKAIFYLNKGVDLEMYTLGYSDVNTSLQTSDWRTGRAKFSYFLKAQLKNFILKNNSIILNKNRKEIGRTLAEINIKEEIDTSKPLNEIFEIWLNGFTKQSKIHELTYEEILQTEKIDFAIKDESSFIIFKNQNKNERPRYKRKQISYNIETCNLGKDESFMLLKTCKTTYDDLGFDDDIETKHEIEVTCFPDIYNRKDSIVFKREGINKVELRDNYDDFYYWQVLTYGCCLSPAKTEVADFKTGKSLIKCHETYYVIQFQESKDFIFLGYEPYKAKENNNGIIGFLNYSINGKNNGKVVLKAKQIPYADSCYGDNVSYNLIQIDSTDYIFEWENYKIRMVYDYYSNSFIDSKTGNYTSKKPKFKSINDATGIGLEFTFKPKINNSEVERKAKVLFNKGIVQEKEIIIDFD